MTHSWTVREKQVVLQIAEVLGNNTKSHRDFHVPRSTFYEWKRALRERGQDGLIPKKPIAKSHPRALHLDAVEKILELRKSYRMGPERITWYLARYHGIETSCSTVFRTLARHGVGPLPKGSDKRAVHTRRYAKSVPGHHVQVDVKILSLKGVDGKKVRRYQYTAIDDATRIRALKIYARHNQDNAISFIEYVVAKFPFRIHTIRTDRGHEFQALFHWYVEDAGMRHVYIKPRTPQLNGKVERSHRTDREEFYQLLTYKDDVDLNQKLAEWERFYNYDRPHGAFKGKTPYESLKSLLASGSDSP